MKFLKTGSQILTRVVVNFFSDLMFVLANGRKKRTFRYPENERRWACWWVSVIDVAQIFFFGQNAALYFSFTGF